LALVPVAEPAPMYFAVVPTGRARPVLASFGTLSITIPEYAARLGFEPGRPIAAGIGQVSRPIGVASSRDVCGRYHASDTICSRFSEPTVEAEFLQSAAVCQGDSGAPLLQRGADGSWGVVGIASYYSPPPPDPLAGSCLVDSPRVSHFVDLQRYTDWINSEIGGPLSLSSSPYICVSALFARGALDIFGYTGSITVTAFEKSSSGEVRAPVIAVSGDYRCQTAPSFGLAACDISNPSYAMIQINSDFGQVTMCGR